MDTAVTVLMAALLLVTAIQVWRLQQQVAEMRLDQHETHALICDALMEDESYTYAGDGDEDYCTYTMNGVAK